MWLRLVFLPLDRPEMITLQGELNYPTSWGSPNWKLFNATNVLVSQEKFALSFNRKIVILVLY